MLRNTSLTVLAATFLCSTVALAKAPAAAPAGTTGMCKDGSYTSALSKTGACSGHDGIQKWYGVPAEASTATADTTSAEKGTSSGKSKKKTEAAAPAAVNTATSDSSSSATGTTSSKSKKKSKEVAPAADSAPMAATTGVCKDGSSTTAASKSGACSGHGGLKEWYASAGTTARAAAPMSKVLPATAATPATASAAAPADAATGMCKDGSSTSAASKGGACSGHGGVKEWYAAGASMSKATPASSATPATASAAPADAATGTCKDGSTTSAATKSGACSGHGGVKEWYAAAGTTAATATGAIPATAEASATAPTYTPPATPAPGGGPGQVWVNNLSKVYHCPNDRWYGKTKEGAYMSEANAIAQGNRADHGKACQ